MSRNSEFNYDSINQGITQYSTHSWTYDIDIFLRFKATPTLANTSSSSNSNSNSSRDNCISFPIHLPLHSHDEDVGVINLTYFIQIFGENTMKVYNAILTSKRVLIVGYNHSASDVAQLVVTAASTVSPYITGLVLRTFPYANLTDLSFLQVPGYIAGRS